ncbi:MAG: 30S ribosomal protein S6 [Planctomycetes bacterium]|nr:30S ribosomal protein S6 [Planctomycetota bacterium]
MLLLDNREVRKGWQPLKDLVTGLFTKHGAQIKICKRWDERRLAYPIRRQLRGTYLLIYFSADTQAIGGIRRDLEFFEPVLRHLTQAIDEIPATAFEPETAFDESQVRVEDVASRREAAQAEREAAAAAARSHDRAERAERGSSRGAVEAAEVEDTPAAEGGESGANEAKATEPKASEPKASTQKAKE